MKNTVQHYP